MLMDAVFIGLTLCLWVATVLMVKGLARLDKPEVPRS
jgi:hypothetical protein